MAVQPLQPASPRPLTGVPPQPPARLAALVRTGVLDAELAALLWILLEARTPVLVVGEAGADRVNMADPLADCLPATAVILPVTGDDGFAWLPQARNLGWVPGPAEQDPRGGQDAPVDPDVPAVAPADPATGVLVVRDLADGAAGGPAADRARVLVRALSLGYGMLATMHGGGLDDALERLNAPDVATVEDERSWLGVVLVMAPPDTQRGPRVAAAHYLRPVALDTHGHMQRRPPAVLATWNEAGDRWDHFAWGVLPDLAGRVGMTPRELEGEQARRASALGARSAPPTGPGG